MQAGRAIYDAAKTENHPWGVTGANVLTPIHRVTLLSCSTPMPLSGSASVGPTPELVQG